MNESEYKIMVEKAFDSASSGYDRKPMRFFDLSAAHLVEKLSLSGDEHVLDSNTGTGKVAIHLAQRLPHGKVTGIDLSQGMLSKAREKALQQGLNNVDFLRQDITQVNFRESQFNGLTCSFGPFFWLDMEGTLRSVTRFIKPQGFVAFTSFFGNSFKPLSELCLQRFEKFGVQLPKTYTWERLDSPQKHKDLCEKSGLKYVESEVSQMGYFLENETEWWDLVLHTGFRGFLNQLSPEKTELYRKEHLEEIAAQATKEGIFLDVKVIFTIATV